MGPCLGKPLSELAETLPGRIGLVEPTELPAGVQPVFSGSLQKKALITNDWYSFCG